MLLGFTNWWRHFISKSLVESNLPVLCSSQLLSFSFFTSLCHFFKKNVVNSLVWSSLGFAFDSTIVAYWSNTKSQLIFISRFSFQVLKIICDMIHMVWYGRMRDPNYCGSYHVDHIMVPYHMAYIIWLIPNGPYYLVKQVTYREKISVNKFQRNDDEKWL